MSCNFLVLPTVLLTQFIFPIFNLNQYMMNSQRKSLLMALFVGAVAAAPVFAQDVQSGLKDLESERYVKAEQTFKQLATTAPTADNQFNLGYYYLRTNQPDLAKAAFDKGAATDPKNQLNNVGLGGVALAKKNRAGARTLIDGAVQATKSKDQNVLMRAGEMYTLFETNDPAEAVRLIDLADKLDKKNTSTEIEMIYGDAYNIKNDGGNAVSKYENALLITPNLAEANYKIGRVYLRGKNYKEAQRFFETAIQNDPEFAPTYKAFADALANSRAYKKASTTYDSYVQKSGTADPELLLDVARYKFLAQDNLGAISYLNQLKGKINDPIIDRIYGWANYGLGKYPESIESLNKFIAAAPAKVIYDDYVYLGRSYSQQGTPEGDSLGVVYLEKAAPQDTTENLYREIAQKYMSAKRYDKAAAYYAKTIANDKKPLNGDYQNLGLANYQFAFVAPRTVAKEDTAQQRQLKRLYFMRADSAFAKLAEVAPTFPVPYYYRGTSNYYMYTPTEALGNGIFVPYHEKFIEAVNALPDTTEKRKYEKNLVTAYKLLGAYSFAKKDEAKGRDYITKVLAIDPNDKEAKAYMEGPKATAPTTPSTPKPKAPVKKSAASK